MNADIIRRKLVMHNYYSDLKSRAKVYHTRFPESPRMSAVRMIWWNFKALLKCHIVETKTICEKSCLDASLGDYIHFLENQKKSYTETFVKLSENSFERRKQDTKVIAWYLPQFYQIEVNDRFHGKGFTEWTNTTQAIPLYTGHYQPHIPYDLGYYDLNNLNVIKRQVELAKQYGIYGFCFHWYWFSGERIMEKPVEMYLSHPELELPFCFNWANENWSASWNGEDKNLIFEQRIDEADDQHFISDLLPYFKDPRYIKMNGCPVFSIYHCNTFNQSRFISLLEHCRNTAKKEGFPDLYIILTTGNRFNSDPKEWGADAIVEYPTLIMDCAELRNESGYLNPDFKGTIWKYSSLVQREGYMRELHSEEYYRAALVGFDNSARKAIMDNCFILDGATPDEYKKWMKRIILESKEIHSEEANMVYVLAWNEWAEAAHLEPDMKFGYGYLQATREALEETRTLDENVILEKIAIKHAEGIKSIHFYVNCVESLGDIIACEPIARYLKATVPECQVTWLVKDVYQQIVKFNSFIDEVERVDCLGTAIIKCNAYARTKDSIIIDCHYDKRWCVKTGLVLHNLNNTMVNEGTYFKYGPLLTTFCLSAGLPALSLAPLFHEASDIGIPRELPDHYVVIHCTPAEACKAWINEAWEQLTEFLAFNGYSIVEIGLTPVVKCLCKKYFDFTDIHDIQQISQIVKRASFFIGIDSAFAHLANCYQIPGIVIMGQYKNFNRYIPYTGGYGDGTNATLVYSNDGPAANVPVGQVEDAFLERIRYTAK